MCLLACLLAPLPAFFAVSSTTTYECGRGPERVWYLRGTQDFDLPFSQVGRKEAARQTDETDGRRTNHPPAD